MKTEGKDNDGARWEVGKRGGIDTMKSNGGFVADVGVGVCKGVGERWNSGGSLRTKFAQSICGSASQLRVAAVQAGKKGRDGNLRRGLEIAKRDDCESLNIRMVRWVETVGDGR